MARCWGSVVVVVACAFPTVHLPPRHHPTRHHPTRPQRYLAAEHTSTPSTRLRASTSSWASCSPYSHCCRWVIGTEWMWRECGCGRGRGVGLARAWCGVVCCGRYAVWAWCGRERGVWARCEKCSAARPNSGIEIPPTTRACPVSGVRKCYMLLDTATNYPRRWEAWHDPTRRRKEIGQPSDAAPLSTVTGWWRRSASGSQCLRREHMARGSSH